MMSGRAAAAAADFDYCASVAGPVPGLSVERQQAFPHCSKECSAAPILLRNPTAVLIDIHNIIHASRLQKHNSC